eukprot:716816-Prorocentrum_minimum.AAC.4
MLTEEFGLDLDIDTKWEVRLAPPLMIHPPRTIPPSCGPIPVTLLAYLFPLRLPPFVPTTTSLQHPYRPSSIPTVPPAFL